MILRGYLAAALLAVVLLAVLLAVDVVIAWLQYARNQVAAQYGVQPVTTYSDTAERIAGFWAWIGGFILLALIAVYSLHTPRR